MTITMTTIRRRVSAKTAKMSKDVALKKIATIREEGVTIFHPTIRELTGGYNSQSINEYVMRKLGIAAGIIKERT